MGLKIDEIIAVTIVCVFYTVLLGDYTIRLFKKWRNRKKKAADTDIEAQNENTEMKEPSLPSDQLSSRRETTDIVAPNQIETIETKQRSD